MKTNVFLKLLATGIMATALGVHAQEAKPEPKKPVIVKATIETSKGTIELVLDEVKAPITVQNFISYAGKGHYEGTIFHRVIPGFMIQGGGFTADMNQKPVDKPIAIESQNGLKNARGTIAMARTNDPNSATSQFFINVKDNANLDYPSFDGHGYAVFGKVTKGLDIVDAIVGVPTTRKGPHADVPAETITITKVTVTKEPVAE
ncbi:MAG TPA: peptidylprolyl isomerase [Candidatus Saccharimonadia bacterium]|nr:peptidylprolyl isomerase [Candidatus Saccharimonadia bacterium]